MTAGSRRANFRARRKTDESLRCISWSAHIRSHPTLLGLLVTILVISPADCDCWDELKAFEVDCRFLIATISRCTSCVRDIAAFDRISDSIV